ncbi:MAG TPA: PEP-CTERM sorting domain-containing protein [Terrimicrobiaceae bacterium]|nr:PEP-CTERM sorting domain-containing protein [Terrimicrobiaceae bacterium]
MTGSAMTLQSLRTASSRATLKHGDQSFEATNPLSHGGRRPKPFAWHSTLLRALCFLLTVLAGIGPINAAVIADFQLLTWGDSQAGTELPSASGRKPSAGYPAASDWLIFTPDDQAPGSNYNPQGALSHSLADIPGTGGSSFNMAPSLTGTISLEFAASGLGVWDISVTGLAYSGQATPVMFMNQFLVTPETSAAQNGGFIVDGMGNSGTWNASAAGAWTIQYGLDFYLATNADGDPASGDVDATFNDTVQQGYLLPISLLTAEGLSSLSLDDPAGMYAGDFATYLLNEIAPRLPEEATYLLVTQMSKVNPDYSEVGLPITTNTLIGNTTIAFTTGAIPEPSTFVMLFLAVGLIGCSFRRRIPSENCSTR